MKTVDLSGIWECSVPGQSGEIRLPGTLDEAGFGFPDDPARQWQAEDVKRIGFWQEGEAATGDMIPAWDLTGVCQN